jgi:hypothetical protein
MDNGMIIALIAVGAVAGLALLMRRGTKDEVVHRPPGADDVLAGDEVAEASSMAVATGLMDEPDEDTDDEHDEALADARVPVTSEGIVMLPDGEDVRLIPMVDSDQAPDWVRKGIEDGEVPYQVLNRFYGFRPGGAQSIKPGTALSSGDFTAARVRRGEGGSWLVETLGRDGDFGFLPFESESGAREALAMLEHANIVQRPLDDDGTPIPAAPGDFEEARRRYEETERDLALGADDEPMPPADWSSRR